MSKRLAYIDISLAQRVRETYAASVKNARGLLTTDPGRLIQTRYESIAGSLENIAKLSYALGDPVENVLDLLRKSVEAYEQVVKLRGTEDPMPILNVTLDTRLPPSDPNYAKTEPAQPPGTKDYSMGNADDSARHVFLSLIVGKAEMARHVALHISDPPKAEWVGYHKYATYTVNDQRLAYALRKFYEDDHEGGLKLVNMIGPTRGELNDVIDQATMWKGLLQGQAPRFFDGLIGLLHWYQTKSESSPRQTNYYLCLPGLGLSALAIQRGIVKREQLPQDNPFMPLDLLPNQWHVA